MDDGTASKRVGPPALLSLFGVRVLGITALAAGVPLAPAAKVGVQSTSCPRDAIAIEPGVSIQATVDRAREGAAFCLKKGIHRVQVVRPRAGQLFYGEGETVLNGSRLLDGFRRENRYGWRTANSSASQNTANACRPRPAAISPMRYSSTTSR